MSDLRGKHALVTGASYGLGPHIAAALAEQGINLTLTARSEDKLRGVAETISQRGVRVVAVPCDIRDPVAREGLIARAEAVLGPIDILVNNAGVHHGGRLAKRTPDDIAEVLETNLKAPVLLTRRLLPAMLRRGHGHLVHITSAAGKAGLPYLTAYVAAKHGMVGFNQSLQAELHGTGVSSSAIVQGFCSGDGMWARLNRSVHPAFGLSQPRRVARAVVLALRARHAEIVVNPLPIRPVFLLWAVWPSFALMFFRLLRVDRFLEGVGLQIEAEEAMGAAPAAQLSAATHAL